MHCIYDLLGSGKKAFLELSRNDRFMHAFWLLGPFFLLIERTPGDVYISIVALTFLIRSLKKRDYAWLRFFWVKSVFIFWGICLFSAVMSQAPSYAFGEALIWIRFPLFAMATAFWLGADKRLLFLMFFSTASAILLMCGILAAELAIEGFKSRLSWPYDDFVTGNYLAKVGLPVIVFSTTLFLSLKGAKSLLSGCFCLLVIGMTMMTGERINFLIGLFAALLAVFVWEKSWIKRFSYMIFVSLIPISILVTFPAVFDRFGLSFFDQLPLYKGSPYYDAMAPAWLIFEKFPTLGIGAGNFRHLCADLIQPGLGYDCHNHPHNFYLQILSETGFLGLILAVIFIVSIIAKCFGARTTSRHVLYSVAWVIPFALFWPIRSSADFFGQWNNIFLWSAVALALAIVHSKSKNI